MNEKARRKGRISNRSIERNRGRHRVVAGEGGAVVAVNYASDRNGADRVVEKIKAAGGKAIAVQGSVTSSEDIDRFFSETEKQLGNVDVLVNNAGVGAVAT